MTPEQIVDIFRNALLVALQISVPLLLISMVIGFTLSVFQSVTQINEMTLTFVPKILIFSLALLILFPWMLKTIIKFTNLILISHWDKITSLSTYAS